MHEGVYVPRMEQKEYASKGVAGTALGIGIGALGLNVLQGNGLGGLLGNNNRNTNCGDAWETKEAACLRAENATLRAERYSDAVGISAFKDMVAFVEKQTDRTNSTLKDVTSAVIAQGQEIAVLKADVRCLNSKLDYEISATKQECTSAIALESERRKCGDENLYAYVNATFVPGKLIMPLSSICPPAVPAKGNSTGN